jgi:hypothetical protein
MNTDQPAKWFRMYAEFATDPKVQILSEVEQRRYLMLLCMRCCNGDVTLQDEIVAFQLRICNDEWQKTKSILLHKNLIDDANKPVAWNKRQYQSDSSKSRVSKHRENKKRRCNVTVTGKKRTVETETETEKEKEPSSAAAGFGSSIACAHEGPPEKAQQQQNENQIRQVFSDRKAFLEKQFPYLNLAVEVEQCVAKYRGRTIVVDPAVLVLEWCKRSPKPDARSRDRPLTKMEQAEAIVADNVAATGRALIKVRQMREMQNEQRRTAIEGAA